MFGFLLLLLLIFILLPVFKIGWQIWSNMRRMRRFMADPQEFFRQQQGKAASAQRPHAHAPRRKAKKIDRDTGEYVRFEEVEVSEQELADAQNRRTVSYITESQVTDIEWEEVK